MGEVQDEGLVVREPRLEQLLDVDLVQVVGDEENGQRGCRQHNQGAQPTVDAFVASVLEEASLGLEPGFYGVDGEEGDVCGGACASAALEGLVSGIGAMAEWCKCRDPGLWRSLGPHTYDQRDDKLALGV